MRQKYDVILLFQVLEHMINPKIFLKNIKELLRSDGKIIIGSTKFNGSFTRFMQSI